MFETPSLPYDYNALEPFIDEETMRLHHDKHHVAYTTNLNKALEGHDELMAQTPEDLLRTLEKIPEDIRTAIRNHGGGHVNHSIFWKTMAAHDDKRMPAGDLAKAIDDNFGSFDNFKEQFTKAASTVFGSGWAWLSKVDDKLIIEAMPNQDSPYSLGHTPLLGLDVWEHAYYVKYRNVRPDYIKAFWEIVNWSEVQKRFSDSK